MKVLTEEQVDQIVEQTAPWRLIRELLSRPMFSDAWFSPERIKD